MITKDMSIEEYHADRTILSSTGLKKLKECSRNFVHYVLYGTESKPHFDFGNAFEVALMDKVNGTNLFEKHCAVLETDMWVNAALDVNPGLVSPKASKTYKELSSSFVQEHDGKYLIKDVGEAESMVAMNEMINSCVRDETIRKLLTNTEYQISLFWEDPDTGLQLKTRPDICRSKRNVLLDIKTCKDASPNGFARDASNLDYFLQGVMQIDGAISTGLMEKVDKYFWLAVEKTPPYNVCIYEYQTDDITSIMLYYKNLLKRAATALALIPEVHKLAGDLSIVPSYGEQSDKGFGIVDLEMPLYYRYSF